MERMAVSPDEARELLGVGRTLLYTMIADGRLRAVKVNRRLLVPVEEIRKLLAVTQPETADVPAART
jgi:excisionase family DNA binding protein